MDHRQIVSLSSSGGGGGGGSSNDGKGEGKGWMMKVGFLWCGRRFAVELNINRPTVLSGPDPAQRHGSSRAIALFASSSLYV